MRSITLEEVRRDNSNITYYSRPLWKALRKERFKPLTKEKYDKYVAYRTVSNTLSFDPYDDLDFQMDLDKFKESLTAVEVECFNYFLEGMNQEEIAMALSSPTRQQSVSKMLQKIIYKFSKFYKE